MILWCRRCLMEAEIPLGEQIKSGQCSKCMSRGIVFLVNDQAEDSPLYKPVEPLDSPDHRALIRALEDK